MKKLLNITLFLLTIIFSSPISVASKLNQLVTEIRVFDNDTTFKFQYVYDNQKNKVLETKTYLSGTSWINKSQTEWIYENNHCVLQRNTAWKDNAWSVSYRIEYTYESSNMVSETHFSYENNAEHKIRMIQYEYSNAGLISKKEYVTANQSLSLVAQHDYSYGTNGLLAKLSTNVYENATLQKQYKSVFEYNADKQLTRQFNQETDSLQVWKNTDADYWFYVNGTNLISSQRVKVWNTVSSAWENSSLLDYEYDNNNLLTSETCYYWKTMFWEKSVRYDYRYDADNNLAEKMLSNSIYHKWRNTLSINYTADTLKKTNTIESVQGFWGGTAGELISSYIAFPFNDETGIEKGKRLQINYAPVKDTGLPNIVTTNNLKLISVYPNPSDGVFYIDTQNYNLKSWTVYDMKGMIIQQNGLTVRSGIVDLSALPKGLYMLRVQTDNDVLSQKLIRK